MEMTKYKLGDIAKTGSGGTPKSTVAEYYENGNIPWINSGELNNPFISTTSNFITQKGYDNSSAKLFPPQTVLLAMYGATAGKASLLEFEACTNQAICAIMPNQDILLPRFLKYKLDTMYNYLVGLSTGSARDNLSQDGIKALELCIPPLSEQKKIASVLSALDDKIALNKKMNQKLEAMAKRLYDYWFVQYDFPDKNGRPYKTTGGPMTYNPTLKREIPVGWEVKQICDITKIFNGSTPSTTEEENYGGEIVWITPKDLSDQNCKFVYQGARNITQAGYDSCSTTMVPKGTVVMSSRAPIGLLSIAQCDLCTNQGFKNMVPNDMTDSKYLYYTIQQHIPQIQNLGTGTTFKEVSKDELGRFAILYPPKKLIATFEEKVAPIFDVQFNKVKEISRLTTLRDKLLPLLMNGQVEVGKKKDGL
ncbi:MAG: restriction endonuclease subunit S [Fibrobacteraceae bacterium]|nr:restriction endonuclease subunit S [Fibrobacteraceae bacterium]